MQKEKILILGASGYIGQRLTKKIIEEENENVDLVLFSRNKRKLVHFENDKTIKINIETCDIPLIEENKDKLNELFKDATVVYYLIHSMSEEDNSNFMKQEKDMALFVSKLSEENKVKQIIYLGGLGIGEFDNLSTHLKSRQQTGEMLRKYSTPVTEFRAGVIIGGGGSSFEIIRTLATKLPFIPVFFKKEGKCETIFVDNVISFLVKAKNESNKYKNKILEIGNGEQKTYSELVQIYADKVLNKKLKIINLSFLDFIIKPKLIGKVIAFMTGQHEKLIVPLIYGVENDAVVTDKLNITNQIKNIHLPFKRIVDLELGFKLASSREDKGHVLSVWDTPNSLSNLEKRENKYFSTIKKDGLLYEERSILIETNKIKLIFNEIREIGKKGSRYWSFYPLWKIRGYIDKIFGGPGVGNKCVLNRKKLHIGDRIDFWTVEEIVDLKKTKELRLISEMKTPGDAWLQFKIVPNIEIKGSSIFYIRAYFEPKGIFGYIYWYSLYFIHKWIFTEMLNNIVKKGMKNEK